MPDRTCHRCGQATACKLSRFTALDVAEYFRCAACAHVWSRRVDAPGRPPRDVTIYTSTALHRSAQAN